MIWHPPYQGLQGCSAPPQQIVSAAPSARREFTIGEGEMNTMSLSLFGNHKAATKLAVKRRGVEAIDMR
jgi:hypothetical protein